MYPKTCVVFLALTYNLIFTNNVLKKVCTYFARVIILLFAVYL